MAEKKRGKSDKTTWSTHIMLWQNKI
jgi:hypothetical protein